jgi:hypothetical protein
MARRVYFPSEGRRFPLTPAVLASQRHGGGGKAESEAEGGPANRRSRFQNDHFDAFQPDAGMGISRSQSRQPAPAIRHSACRA